MIWFTADLHIGHANIIRHCNRPYSSVQEMNESLILNWNSRVKTSDTIYIVGDLFFRNTVSAEEYLNRMNGKKHLILGNHDKDWIKKVDMPKHFISVDRLAEIGDGKHKITLCHYPMMTWNGMAKGSYLIYGHIHNNTNSDYWPLLKLMPNALNAGVDINKFHPVSFDELLYWNDKFRKQ
jgi:calcineurin-like phosphoesterase family protein